MPKTFKQLKLAVVYDRANTAKGGAERLLSAIAKLWPQADLFTSVYNQDISWTKQFRRVYPSFLQKIPFAKKHHQFFEPLTPLAFESFDLKAYDVVISVSTAQSKAVLTKPHQLHLNYLLTPPRYIYQYDQVYLGKNPNFFDLSLKYLSAPARAYLKWFDQTASLRPDVVVPLSKLVRRRAQTVYPDIKLEKPLYPFAEDLTNFLKEAKKSLPQTHKVLEKQRFNLVVSRLVRYKRIDLAIKASLKLQTPLFIIGEGVELKQLLRLAGSAGTKFWKTRTSTNKDQDIANWLRPNLKNNKLIFFFNQVDDKLLSLLYQETDLVLALGLEDFGLVPLEAAYFGTSSIINAESGVAEVLKDKVETYKLKNPDLKRLIKTISHQPTSKFSTSKLKKTTKKFSQKTYLKNLSRLVYDSYHQKVSYNV